MMNESAAPMTPLAPASPAEGRNLIAPLRHTILLLAILFGFAAYGAYAYSLSHTSSAPSERGSAIPLYIGTMLGEWGLLRLVMVGLKKRGVRIRDLLGERWASWKDVVRDVLIGLTVWALWRAGETFLLHLMGDDSADLSSLLPQGPAEIALWVALSVTAGFCEEVIFRGYFQKQFAALTGSALAAVLLQAVVFGVSHGYQGLRNVVMISVFGAVFGALAWWRRSLKPGIVVHAVTDIFSGIFAKGA